MTPLPNSDEFVAATSVPADAVSHADDAAGALATVDNAADGAPADVSSEFPEHPTTPAIASVAIATDPATWPALRFLTTETWVPSLVDVAPRESAPSSSSLRCLTVIWPVHSSSMSVTGPSLTRLTCM